MRLSPLLLVLATAGAEASDANRLVYLDESDPYYVGRGFPRLTTPQWVGEEGVEAVVVLAIDDMGENVERYEAYLRPILDRLKRIDGRAPVSIMTNRVDPDHPQLQTWLQEGVNIDVHTLTHPCPLLQGGDEGFAEAQHSYHGCVDAMARIPNNRPVAFRMPCCDSLNTPSPRFYAEIFNDVSPEGRFLAIDTSVFMLFTPDDPELPRDLVLEPDGTERFRKYIPFPSFVNTIENYPYPYVIGRLCWQFPCIVPSDWEAQNLHGVNNPKTVEDLKAALDAVVIKQGVMNLVFHPHGWIQNDQIVELIDHAVQKHGSKVKFLNFREALDRLNANLLGGHPIRAANGQDNGVRLIDLNHDGYLDVIIGNSRVQETRLYDPETGRWNVGDFPTTLVDGDADGPRRLSGVRFGVVRNDGAVSMLRRDEQATHAWSFDGRAWQPDPALGEGLTSDGQPILTRRDGRDTGVRLRDLDGDGRCALVVANPEQNAVFAWSDAKEAWVARSFALPDGARVVDRDGRDAGLRFVDLDEDGLDDVVFSHDEGHGVVLRDSMASGWTRVVLSGRPGDETENALPPIVRDGANNGFWVHSRHLWWQNEHTATLPDLVDRRSFNDLLLDIEPRPKTPEASLQSFRARPGFVVELVAAEPLVHDPVAFEWGADGTLWVVEMGDYPRGVDETGTPGGVVRSLQDTHGDGIYDTSTVFLDGLPFPTGVMPWRDGVLISAAPDILYAEDRDGDGRADHVEVLFTGFGEGNQQHRVNGFAYGLDNWVHAANGDSGGQIRSTKTGATVDISGRDFRFHPDDGRFETESGQTQFGRHRDDWGHWFGNTNSVWAWHYVLSDRYLRRNPHVASPSPRLSLQNATRVFPVSPTLARFNDPHMTNQVTSANSAVPYRDVLFGPVFDRNLFVSEPVHNLVHRVVLEPEGATFRGRRFADETEREFLASSDSWFRPTMLKTGPDGALWIADMYRLVIEHPEYIPDELQEGLKLRAGVDKGRIYRVYPVDQTPRPIPRLDRLDTAGLVAALDSPNGWQRDTAQRLLVHQGDRAAVAPLRHLARDTERPQTRIQALWTLDGLGALTAEDVKRALADPHPEVRRNALQAGEPLLERDSTLGEAMVVLVDDPESRVRAQLALSLGFWDDSRAGEALALLALRDADDPWMRAAVLSSARPHAGTILATLFARADPDALPSELVEPLFATAGASRDAEALTPLVDAIGTPNDEGHYAAWQFAALAGLLDAAARARTSLVEIAQGHSGLRRALPRLDRVWDQARALVEDEDADEARRRAVVRLLGRADPPQAEDLNRLRHFLQPRYAASLQAEAVASLARLGDDRVPAALLDGWRGHSPEIRGRIFDTLLSRDGWTNHLLEALETGRLTVGEVDAARRQALREHREPAVRARAEALFAEATSDRAEVIERYRPALALRGDPIAGSSVFQRVCASCHRLGDVGHEVGPDLAALSDKAPESLLIAILDPNRAVETPYASFVVSLIDGRVLTGVIASETSNSVLLRRQDGQDDVILRADIEEMAGSGQSLMPEGLEADLSHQDLADLIAFLRETGPPPKPFEGNQPEVVRQAEDGTIVLTAKNAEIYGDSLIFETPYENLGYWSSPNDRAVWRLEVERPGRYEVWFDWACRDDTQGDAFVLEVGPDRVEGTVAGTGTWDDYRTAKIGEVALEAGRQRLEVRPGGPIQGAMIDLRTVELRPKSPDEALR